MTNNCILLYCTFGSVKEAETIIDALLDKKLVACANRLPAITSYYTWQNKRETSEEIAVIFKTTDANFSLAEFAICQLHSYDCPCIIALPVSNGHQPFLSWIENNVGTPDV